jgi:Glyoxalase/Bleomycin resistance protein/Dioxygenase superfamily
MKTLFGEPMQIAYVVRDIEASVNEWTRSLGVGPWFYAEHFALTNYRYRGRPTAGPVISVAQTYHGMTQIELIQVI